MKLVIITRARELLAKAQLSLFPGMALMPGKKDPTKKRWQQMKEETPAPKTPSLGDRLMVRAKQLERKPAKVEPAKAPAATESTGNAGIQSYLQGSIRFGSEDITRAEAIRRLDAQGADETAIHAFLEHADARVEGAHPAVEPVPETPPGPETKPVSRTAAPAPAEEPAPAPEPAPEPRQVDHPWAVAADALADKPLSEVLTETPAFGVPVGKNTQWRINTNERAAALLTKPKDTLTDEDRDVLRAYSGEGRTGDGDLTSYYTPPEAVSMVWKVLAKLGFRGGKVLEPACGNGVFMHYAPKGCLTTGVEYSPVPAAIAERIHPNTTVESMPFEQWNTAHPATERFDAVVMNPPFGVRGGLRGMDKSHITRYEQYFVSCGLDRCKPGGLVACVVPTGVMGITANHLSGFRSAMTRKGRVVAAFRLPTSTFARQGTEQTCDVVVFRKFSDEVAIARKKMTSEELRAAWSDSEKAWANGNYFRDNPDNVLGPYAPKEKVWRGVVVEGEATPELFDRATKLPIEETALPTLDETIAVIAAENPERADAVKQAVAREAAVLAKDPDAPKVGDVKSENGHLYRLNENSRWERVDDPEKTLCGELGVGSFADLRRKALEEGVYFSAGQFRMAAALAASTPAPDSFDETLKQAAVLIDAAKTPEIAEKVAVAALLGWRCRQLQLLQVDASEEGQLAANNLRVRLVKDLADYEAEFTNPRSDKNLNAFAGRSRALTAIAAAYKEDGTMADYLSRRTFTTGTGNAPSDPNSLASCAAWLALRQEQFTAAQVAAVWKGGTPEEAAKALLGDGNIAVAGIEGGQMMFQPMSRYCTGTIGKKTAAARELVDRIAAGVTTLPEDLRQPVSDKLSDQAELLEDMMPRRTIEDFDFNPRAGFVPVECISDWLNEDPQGRERTGPYDRDVRIERLPSGAYKAYTRRAGSNETWSEATDSPGAANYHSHRIMNYLNRFNMRQDDAEHYKRMEDEFRTWVMEHPKWRKVVEDAYNEAFADSIEADYSLAPMPIPGMTKEVPDRDGNLKPFSPHGVQYRTVRHMLDRGCGGISLDVGIGKTLTALMLLQAGRAEGRWKKPLIVVPNSLMANWPRAVRKYFPGIDPKRVLVIDGQGEKRQRQLHDAANNEWDLVIMSRDTFVRIPMRAETQQKFVADDFWVSRSSAMGKERKGKIVGKAKKEMENAQASFEGKVAARLEGKKADLYFEDIGFDCILSDEFHAYKNLSGVQTAEYQGIKYLAGGTEGSDRAIDFQYKTRWIRDNNGGRNVFGLSATPTPNSPIELYTMLGYLAPEEWKKRGVANAEDFIDRFCETEQRTVMTTDGGFAQKRTLVGFKNLRELRSLWRQYFSSADAKEAGVVIPKANTVPHMVEMPPRTSNVYAGLRQRAADLAEKHGYDPETGDSILSVLDRMEKASIALPLYYDSEEESGENDIMPAKYKALYGAAAEGMYHSPKIDEMVATAKDIHAKGDGGQVVFCDKVVLHDEIKKRLVLAGIPENQIGIVNAQATKDAKDRQAVADAFNAGKLRVVIGNTAVMGEGMSFQKRCTDGHHLDYAWNNAGMHQRNGRFVRQGNLHATANIHKYMMQGSFDAYRIDMIDGKKTWQDQILNGNSETVKFEDTEEVGADDIKVLLSPDPEHARKLLTEQRAKQAEAIKGHERDRAYQTYAKLCILRDRMKRAKTDDLRTRLQQQEQTMVQTLQKNPHFEHKDFLRTGEPLVYTASGMVVTKGQFVEMAIGNSIETHRRLVKVLDVNPMSGEVTVDAKDSYYGSSRQRKLKSEEFLKADPKTVEASAANLLRAKLDAIEGYSDLFRFTSSERTANAGEIEQRLTGKQAYITDAEDGHVRWTSSYRPEEGKVIIPSKENYEQLLNAVGGGSHYDDREGVKRHLQTLVPPDKHPAPPPPPVYMGRRHGRRRGW